MNFWTFFIQLLTEQLPEQGYATLSVFVKVIAYKGSKVVIKKWLTLAKYPFLKCQWNFSLLPIFVGVPLCATRWVSCKKREPLTVREHIRSPRVFGVAHQFGFLLCLSSLCVLFAHCCLCL